MAIIRTQINGATQIQQTTITWDRMVSGAIVPTASLVDGANFVKKDGSVAFTGNLNLGGNLATNAGTPVAATDLTTKAYVDAKVGGIGGFHDVKALASSNISVTSAPASIDGVTLAAGDLILAINQTAPATNGPWQFVSTGAAFVRPTWFASAAVVNEGQYFLVAEGATYQDSKFFMTTTGVITVDTTSLTFSQDLSGTVYTAGTGLLLSGGAFSVNYGTTAGTAVQGNDSRIVNALSTTSLGTGVLAALETNIGVAGAPVLLGGAGGTPSSLTLTNASGLPISGINGLGSGVPSALAAVAGAGSGIALLSSGVIPAGEFPALTGDVTTTAGSLVTTINNTSGSGFTKYTDFVENETPSGAVNGSNASYTLAHSPANVYGGVSSLQLMLNGDVLENSATGDYTISGPNITMNFFPLAGDKLRAAYMI